MRKVWLGLLAVGIATAAMPRLAFVGAQTAGRNTFTAGTIDLAATPARSVVTLGGMAPGDSVSSPLVVANHGSLPLDYTTTTSVDGSGPLARALELTITDVDGAPVYSGSLSNGGVGGRALAAGGSEALIISVRLPRSAGNALRHSTATATFTFVAEPAAGPPVQ